MDKSAGFQSLRHASRTLKRILTVQRPIQEKAKSPNRLRLLGVS
ncbi:hypothetical protein EMIT019CA3_60009 [Bacillus pseudomycoides]